MKKVAIVMFVKTPYLSPCKTRLAKRLGQDKSLDFYKRSIQVTLSVIQELTHEDICIDPYFAVAEEEGMNSSYWSAIDRVYQGIGGLGDRLAKVYEELITKYNGVLFLGSDCPHIKKDVLNNCLDHFSKGKTEYLLGKCSDGGFYVFGGSSRLHCETWTSVEYSRSTTADQLIESLNKTGDVKKIEESFDIDTYKDLEQYEHIDQKELSNTQQEFITWVEQVLLNKVQR
jgi:uncharacterized protein